MNYKIFLTAVFTVCFFHVDAGVTNDSDKTGGTDKVYMKHSHNKVYTDTWYVHYKDEYTTEIYGKGSTPTMYYETPKPDSSSAYEWCGIYYKFYDNITTTLRTWKTKKIIVNEGITELGEDAFSAMKTVEEISLPSTLTTIGFGTFFECNNLKSLIIPKNVTVLHPQSIYIGQPPVKLESIINLSTEPQKMQISYTGYNDFIKTFNPFPYGSFGKFLDFENIRLYVPKESIGKYEKSEGWKNFKHIIGLELNIVGEDEIKLMIGETIKLDAKILPADIGLNTKLKWRTDRNDILRIDGDGNITAIKPGEAKVTVQSENVELEDFIIVTTDYPTGINSIDEQRIVVKNGVMFINTPQKEVVKIYNLSGKLLKSVIKQEGQISLKWDYKGMFIVRYSGESIKFIN